jgi:hypothetical protein
MIIQRLFLVESGTYNDQFYRPYQPVVEQLPKVVGLLEEAIGNRPTITAAGLAGLAGQVMMPSAVAQGPVNIFGGWGERRFYFMLEVDFPSNFGTPLKQVITGYTNYVGASLQSKFLDPNMEFHVNGVTTMRLSTEDQGWGPMNFWIPQDNSQILYNDYSPSLTTIGSQPSSIRPMDVFDTVGLTNLPVDAMRLDQRTTFSDGARKSRRSNNSMPDYLARVLNAASQAFAGALDYNDQETAMATASDTVQEGLISADNFLSWLKQRGAMTPSGGFLLQTLINHDPGLSNPTDLRLNTFFRSARGIGSVAHERGTTENWSGSLMETQFANILAQAIPAIMTDCLLTKANIIVGNRNLSGEMEISAEHDPKKLPGTPQADDMYPINGFVAGMDLTPYVNKFFMSLKHKVLNDLCQNGMIDFMASVRCEITRDTWITIQIGPNPPVTFNYPTFADAMMAPTMSPNQQFLGDFANSIGVMINSMNSQPGHKMQQQPMIAMPQGFIGGSHAQPQAPMGGLTFNNGDDYGSSSAL